jgi:hypothetical protein
MHVATAIAIYWLWVARHTQQALLFNGCVMGVVWRHIFYAA